MQTWEHGLPDGVFFARLALATVLGLAIGFERQWRQRTAGLHTMTLVAVGAALFCALPGLGGKVSDPWRVAAQVVTGVGFLAGGVILRQGLDVRGLTTAATLWATAAGRALLGTLPRAQAPSLLPPEPFPAFTPHTKTTWADVNAAITEGRRNGMHAEQGEIDPSLSCCAIPLLDGDRDEKLALAVSFETRRADNERRAIQQALRREWRQLTWQI